MRTKKMLRPAAIFDARGMEEKLEEMSLNGWLIKRAGLAVWTFEEAEPKERRFSVILTRSSGLYPDKSEEQQGIADMAESSGWKLMDFRSDIMIFMTEDQDADPLETDDKVQLMNIKSTKGGWLNSLLGALTCTGLYFIVEYILKSGSTGVGSKGFLLASGIIHLIVGGIGLAGYYKWLSRAENAAEAGRDIPDALDYMKTMRVITAAFIVYAAVYAIIFIGKYLFFI